MKSKWFMIWLIYWNDLKGENGGIHTKKIRGFPVGKWFYLYKTTQGHFSEVTIKNRTLRPFFMPLRMLWKTLSRGEKDDIISAQQEACICVRCGTVIVFPSGAPPFSVRLVHRRQCGGLQSKTEWKAGSRKMGR